MGAADTGYQNGRGRRRFSIRQGGYEFVGAVQCCYSRELDAFASFSTRGIFSNRWNRSACRINVSL